MKKYLIVIGVIAAIMITVVITAGIIYCLDRTGDVGVSQDKAIMNEAQAMKIAVRSSCTDKGSLTGESFYNENSRTWWFDLDIQKEGCNPACVVYEDSGKTEINWRCTGLKIE